MTETIVVYTDGSCLKNPDGPGGWAAVFLLPDGSVEQRYGPAPSTTNNRMELTAAIMALRLSGDAPLLIVSDSKYVVDGATSWMPGWKAKGWRKSTSGEIVNLDLWKMLDAALGDDREVAWEWTRGHSGTEYNELADQLCGQAAREQGAASADPVDADGTGAPAPIRPSGLPVRDHRVQSALDLLAPYLSAEHRGSEAGELARAVKDALTTP